MKNALFTIFKIFLLLVLIGKILNWFLDFDDSVNRALNVTMFSIIGIVYLLMGYVWSGRLTKITIMVCGLFLIAMNFFDNNTVLDIVGIICILAPMLIARFYKEKTGKGECPAD